jgi:y4mF family transcriptional regulator
MLAWGASTAYCPIGQMAITHDISTAAELGSVIRYTRQGRDLRLEDLALAADVGIRFLSELERGKPTVRLGETLRVLEALGLQLGVKDPRG